MLHLPDTGIRVDDRIDSRPEAWDILLAVETAEDNEGICEERLGACQMGPFSRKACSLHREKS